MIFFFSEKIRLDNLQEMQSVTFSENNQKKKKIRMLSATILFIALWVKETGGNLCMEI